jgi:hydrogenase-4 component B
MSGVIIKIGIYGILRILLLTKTDFALLGYIILCVSLLSGVYGVMLAIIQHNLKKLLAYHSIENIGIIGIGIGLGTIGIGTNNPVLITLGFAGGMLHVLNHSLFKSLLFFSAGSIYQTTHTMNIERLGGLVKHLPHTSFLFLIASLAICGLPPFNGFVSEFLIYSGLFAGLGDNNPVSLLVMLTGIFGLAIIGGLAILCFTKAFGVIFSGTPRYIYENAPTESNKGKLIPMYLILALILGIGLMPQFFFNLLSSPIKLFSDKISCVPVVSSINSMTSELMTNISRGAMGFLVLAGMIYYIRKKIIHRRPVVILSTWGCAYTGNQDKMQYTASSFIRTYRKLAEPLLSLHRKKKEIKGIFPHEVWHETHPGDKAEEWLIDAPLNQVRYFFNKFRFLQNGNPQYYVLYGAVFISLVISVPILLEVIRSLIAFLTQL